MIDNGISIVGIMWVFGGVLIFISLVLLIFGYETRGKNIDDVTDMNAVLNRKQQHVDAFVTPKDNDI